MLLILVKQIFGQNMLQAASVTSPR